MKGLILLPPSSLEENQTEQARRSLKYRFPSLEEIRFCSPESHVAEHQAQLRGEALLRYEKDDLRSYGVVAVLQNKEGLSVHPSRIDHNNCRVYYGDIHGVLRFPKKSIDETEYPFLNTHIFNSLTAQSSNEKVTYFPYGFTYRNSNMGPINEFGHRIVGSFQALAEREPNEKVIAVFGGSAAWSIFCLHDEMFSTLMEEQLNAHAKTKGSSLRFRVLNFAQPMGVVLNEMITYHLFCAPIKPDMVIAHNGFNDFFFGQKSDSYLLNKYDIAYQWNLETWAKMLQEDPDGQPIRDLYSDSVPVSNYPRSIVKAYHNRLQQFRHAVESNGAVFVNGLQPIRQSKKKISKKEAQWQQDSKAVGNLPFVYEGYLKNYGPSPVRNFLNFHKIFGRFDEDRTLFVDSVHTAPDGDRVIAQEYFNLISGKLWESSFTQKVTEGVLV